MRILLTTTLLTISTAVLLAGPVFTSQTAEMLKTKDLQVRKELALETGSMEKRIQQLQSATQLAELKAAVASRSAEMADKAYPLRSAIWSTNVIEVHWENPTS